MKKTIIIRGSNPIDEATREKAISTLNKLPTNQLNFLKRLAETPKAIDKLIENEKVLTQFL